MMEDRLAMTVLMSLMALSGFWVSYRLITIKSTGTDIMQQSLVKIMLGQIDTVVRWVWALALTFGCMAAWAQVVFKPF
jgi:hypothetical protein